ncbi:MAG TPA: hypothetical protein VNG33_16630, partial [Polyangiaceae bacterium]|nr:hypothetical protein [Polyangiaceae bacterium]
MKRRLRALFWSSLVCLAGGCVGGQTGQPSPASASCNDERPVLASDKWGDLTVAERARAFEGHYRATLAW